MPSFGRLYAVLLVDNGLWEFLKIQALFGNFFSISHLGF